MSVFGFDPVPKPKFGRKSEKRGARGKFTDEIMEDIFQRDGNRCVKCGTGRDLEHKPHHVVFRSQGGPGTVDNGVTVCRACHRWAHKSLEGRIWFEQFIIRLYGSLNGAEPHE